MKIQSPLVSNLPKWRRARAARHFSCQYDEDFFYINLAKVRLSASLQILLLPELGERSPSADLRLAASSSLERQLISTIICRLIHFWFDVPLDSARVGSCGLSHIIQAQCQGICDLRVRDN